MPTVATKNGGPVDIMSTLHHGILVDPNSSKEIADALVKILTEPKEWEEMSQNGIHNIMAYSWPSHCKQVLESLEKEKQYVKTHTVRPPVVRSELKWKIEQGYMRQSELKCKVLLE